MRDCCAEAVVQRIRKARTETQNERKTWDTQPPEHRSLGEGVVWGGSFSFAAKSGCVKSAGSCTMAFGGVQQSYGWLSPPSAPFAPFHRYRAGMVCGGFGSPLRVSAALFPSTG